MTSPALSPEERERRFDLLIRATDPWPAQARDRVRHDSLERLKNLIDQDLLALSRQGSPDDFADIYLGFGAELERFSAFCAYPDLSACALVAFGGGFSAGKSSLINALISARVLPVEIDPTTTLPAYVLAGASDGVMALNQFSQRIALTDEEFASLTHDERELYGTQIGRLLQAAFVTRAAFPWPRLAFIDTPGFHSGAQGTQDDAARAARQLDAAQAVVWVVPIKQGTLTDDDLGILARLRPEQPKIVVLSHADLVPDADRVSIVARVQEMLATRNLAVQGVYPVSRHPKYRALLAPLAAHLEGLQSLAKDARFAHRFKALFVRYARGLEAERQLAERQRHQINRLLTLAPDDAVAEALPLRDWAESHSRQRAGVLEALEGLRSRFFTELAQAGKAVGVPLPEPHEIELIDIGGEPRMCAWFAKLVKKDDKKKAALQKSLAALCRDAEVREREKLLRLHRLPPDVLAVLRQESVAQHALRLLRLDRINPAALAVMTHG